MQDSMNNDGWTLFLRLSLYMTFAGRGIKEWPVIIYILGSVILLVSVIGDWVLTFRYMIGVRSISKSHMHACMVVYIYRNWLWFRPYGESP